MKKIFTLFTLPLLLITSLYAQDDVLPRDETGSYAFYEVVHAEGVSADVLLGNARSFLKYYVNKKYRKKIAVNQASGEATAISSFLVYKRGSLGRNVDGAIEYTIRIEVKDGRYRYYIGHFVFQEYQRNRYGRFEPVSGKQRPLEQPYSDLNKGQWEDHKKTVSEKIELLVGEMKVAMAGKPEKQSKSTKVGDDW